MNLYCAFSNGNGFDYGGYFVNLFIIFVFLLIFWLGSRYIVDKRKIGINSNIKILEKTPLGVDKYLLLFCFNQKHYLILIGKNHSELIDVYDDFEEIPNANDGVQKFSNILDNMGKFKKKL